jgi:hypothetical protein
MEIKSPRLAQQLHASLGGKLISLAPVAGMAAGHKIFPG